MRQLDIYSSTDLARPHDAPYFDLPPNWRVDVVNPESVEPLADPQASVTAALADPLRSPPLNELVGPGDQVCIAFMHPVTPCPEHILVPALLRELEAAGVYDHDIILLCANGPHGRTDQGQKVARLGAEVVEHYRVLDHDAGEVIHVGQWQDIPLTVSRHTLEADLLIATGVVAPHLYAGYSGGSETVAIGCAGDATIEALYAPHFLYNPGIRPGQLRGNPFQEAMQLLAHRAGLRFVLNVILDHKGQMMDVQAGDPFLTHQYLVFAASSLYNRPVSQIYDVVIAGLDPPYDASLYQAVLGALFVGLAPRPAVRPGGVILLPASTPEAVGQGSVVYPNAQNFYDVLQSTRFLGTLTSGLWERGCRPGEARAFQLARLLERNKVVVVGSEFPAIVEACHLEAAADMEEAIDLARWLLGDDLSTLIVPHALLTMPIPPVGEPRALAGEDDWVDVSLVGMRTW
jgi:nickel-dependent lactate racemase